MVRECHPWLEQGDVFDYVPVLHPRIEDGITVVPADEKGPAMLLTRGCDMDKPVKRLAVAGASRVKRLHFLPLLAFDRLDANKKALLLGRKVRPFEGFYVGELDGLGEVYCSLSEVYSIPAEFFGGELVPYDIGGTVEGRYTCPPQFWRPGRIDSDDEALLRRKLQAFWTGYSEKDATIDITAAQATATAESPG